jgi:hypothetical protein
MKRALFGLTALIAACETPRTIPVPIDTTTIAYECPPIADQACNVQQGRKLRVFFPTNAVELDSADTAQLDTLIEHNKRASTWIIEGNADARGSTQLNDSLSQARANAVTAYAQTKIGKGAAVHTFFYGEAKPLEAGDALANYQHNRRVDVTPNGDIIGTALSRFPAQAVLADLSSSMTDRHTANGIRMSKWEAVARHPLPDSVDKYIFNSCIRGAATQVETFEGQRPACGTPLWRATIAALNAKQYKSITLLTDGENSRGFDRYTVDDVIRAAKEHGTVVNVIAISATSPSAYQDLQSLATQTGGGFLLAR